MTFGKLRTRRDILRLGGRTLSAIGAASLFGEAGLINARAQSATDYKAMVCIFLFGGNDANNLLIPNDTASYAAYQKVRQNLAISQASLVKIYDPNSKANFGLHPALAPLGALYNLTTGTPRLALAANVGTLVQPTTKANYMSPPAGFQIPVNLFSHSDQQTEWQNAVPQGGATAGWQGRLADKIVQLNTNVNVPPAMGIGGGALQIVGETTQPSAVGTSGFSLTTGLNDPRTAALQQMLNLPSGVTLIQAAQASINSAIQVSQVIDQALNSGAALGTTFPNSGIGSQLAQVAQIIQARTALGANRQIFFCNQGGYDTHSDQLSQQSQLFTDLAAAMAAFDTAMGQLGVQNNVTTFTESDFSRTFQPNGNAGTDHAWGSHVLIMGGAVKGGQICGTFPTLELQGPDDSGDRGNWVPTTSADQYAATLAKWFGVTAQADLDYVFPNLKNFGYQSPAFL